MKVMTSSKKTSFLLLFFSLFSCFAGQISAQNNLDFLAGQITDGTTEQKRSALFQIRNFETAEASRLAVPALQDKAEIVRATAAQSVIFLAPDEAIRVLTPLLRDKNLLVRKETAYALGKTHNPTAIPLLVQTIQKDKIQEVKDAATVALGEIGDVSAVDVLTQILQHQPKAKEEFQRRSAARSLGEIASNYLLQEIIRRNNNSDKSPVVSANQLRADLSRQVPAFQNAVSLLIQILQNPAETDDVKREAAYALGEIGDAKAIPVLQSKLNVEDYYLVKNSKKALQRISPTSAGN